MSEQYSALDGTAANERKRLVRMRHHTRETKAEREKKRLEHVRDRAGGTRPKEKS